MLGSYEKPVTGMTVAERWWEVGRRVENGEAFGSTTERVFGKSADNAVGSPEWLAISISVFADGDAETDYSNRFAMLAYFLALEAEDAATQEAEPYPPTADVVAEEEPIERGGLVALVEAQTYTSAGYPSVYPLKAPDRRKSWNTKLADGMRKWAHWLEERF